MSIHSEMMSSVGIESHLAALGESVVWTNVATRAPTATTAVPGAEMQDLENEGDTNRRRVHRTFTAAKAAIGEPRYGDTIVYANETYTVDDIIASTPSTVTVRAWKWMSVEHERKSNQNRLQ